MSIFQNKFDSLEGIIFREDLKIMSLEISANHKLIIHLNKGLTFETPAKNYKYLKNATTQSLKNYRIVGKGTGLHWPDLDEDLSLKGFLKEFLNQKIKSEKKLIIA